MHQSLTVPDLWQQEAVRALRDGRDVVVHAPTGAGKTYIFELLYPELRGQAIFTVPTRALANDKLAEWRARGWDVGIATGDIAHRLDAKVVVATLETQKGRLLQGRGPALLVIDEYQMIADPIRGVNYEVADRADPAEDAAAAALGSVANPEDVVEWLRRIGRDAVLVSHAERPVPLQEIDLGRRCRIARRGRMPRLVAAADRQCPAGGARARPALRAAPECRRGAGAATWPRRCRRTARCRSRASRSRLAGPRLARLLRARVAYHHSGLSYAQRAGLIEPLAKAGELRVVVATMGLAAGINFSMRSVGDHGHFVSGRQFPAPGAAGRAAADVRARRPARAG